MASTTHTTTAQAPPQGPAGQPATGRCPMHGLPPAPRPALRPEDELVLALRKRMVVQRSRVNDVEQLHVFYEDKEISFDEPELFGFAETLAATSRFRAGDAAQWGSAQTWETTRPLLEQLIEAGVLQQAADADRAGLSEVPASMVRPSPLAPAVTTTAASWRDAADLTAALTGRAVDPGYLELIVPIFRVAHVALDADDRQVGEANVFPRALRLDRPTTWLSCPYPGTRHMNERPMNVTALKAMRLHWKPMMSALRRIRAAFLTRFPEAQDRWTIGDVERLAALVLAVPTYQLMRDNGARPNGTLHPVLSSLFRVVDGVRMTMHQMMFVPIGEPARSPHEVVTAASIFEYAERNYSFHSETGVCAGPGHMIQELLRVLLDGEGTGADHDVALDSEVLAALDDVDEAFEYGLLGLRAHAAFFSLWPVLTRAYDQLSGLCDEAVASGAVGLVPLQQRLRERVRQVRTSTYLATEAWRSHRDEVYADMYGRCGEAMGTTCRGPRRSTVSLPEALQQHTARFPHLVRQTIANTLVTLSAGQAPDHIEALADAITTTLVRVQAVLRTACAVQAGINLHLGRPQPVTRFSADQADVHNILQGAGDRKLPYLIDELRAGLDLDIELDTEVLVVHRRTGGPETRIVTDFDRHGAVRHGAPTAH